MRRRVIPLGVCTELISELNARVAFLLVGQSKVSPGRVVDGAFRLCFRFSEVLN